MFMSQERGAPRKPFQKPNILRRKSKVVRLNAPKNESLDTMSLSSDARGSVQLATSPALVGQSRGDLSEPFQITQTSKFNVGISELCDNNHIDTLETLEINHGDRITIYEHNAEEDNNDTCATQSILNVESFLTDGSIKQNNVLFNIDGTSTSTLETDTKPKWCFDFMSDESKDTVTTNYYDGSQLSNIYVDKSSDMSTDIAAVPLAVVSLLKQETKTSHNTNVPAHNIALDSLKPVTSRADKFKCDISNCNKEFWTEARLQKHKHVHYKEKPTTPPILECPVKKTDDAGIQTKCGRTFLIRNQLMKHLNEEHSPEEALFRCTACGRRFFWAGGARAHQAGACGRAYTCAWAGCDRVFRQPCRLREHARAHTGDRPYPCDYPNCGWAFRSASKLVRHARRHTGERRHVCGACGRAFLRREHLRDHAARHHAPSARPPRAPAPPAQRCTHAECEGQVFSSSILLDGHMKKIHEKNDDRPPSAKKTQKNRTKKEMFVESSVDTQISNYEFVEESIVETKEHIPGGRMDGEVDVGADVGVDVGVDVDVDVDMDVVDGRCARTHCTWPLQRRQEHYALEDEVQVEQSESSESNFFTVRSDLFLHGNVLINEDSEFIIRAATGGEGAGATGGEGEEGGARAQLDSLGLIDSHPTIDLMQEELMYADAVDESSFRVFLLNGEELT